MKKLICSLLFIVFSFVVFAQESIKSLENTRNILINKVNTSKKLLESKGDSRKNYLHQINIINSQILMQQKIIDGYKSEIDIINLIIDNNNLIADTLAKEIEVIKNSYSKLIIDAGKKKNEFTELMMIFSSSTISEAYRRYQLMKEFASYRRKQGILLQTSKVKYDSIISYNEGIINKKLLSINKLDNEITTLAISKRSKLNLVNKLSSEEKWLRSEIANNEYKASKLESTIEKLLADALKNDEVVSFSNFEKSRGNLSWPVSNGIVIGQFGEHNHAVIKGVKVKNNGIDISTVKHADVKCVYPGVVSRVIPIPGYNLAIIIRHGNFLTVYANLTSVSVKKGDKVGNSQKIGKLFATDIDNTSTLHFELWNENKKDNPLDWLTNRM